MSSTTIRSSTSCRRASAVSELAVQQGHVAEQHRRCRRYRRPIAVATPSMPFAPFVRPHRRSLVGRPEPLEVSHWHRRRHHHVVVEAATRRAEDVVRRARRRAASAEGGGEPRGRRSRPRAAIAPPNARTSLSRRYTSPTGALHPEGSPRAPGRSSGPLRSPGTGTPTARQPGGQHLRRRRFAEVHHHLGQV
ncbi:MAG: hypothetical protein R2713_18585 [Ilumatobacteraceae bacterium]